LHVGSDACVGTTSGALFLHMELHWVLLQETDELSEGTPE